MKKVLLFVFAVLALTSCRSFESLNSKTVSEYNINIVEYNFYTTEKLVFERKYSKPSKNKNVDLYTENLKLSKKCKITETSDNSATVQFKNYSFKFSKDSKGEYKIDDNQDISGEKYKLIKGNGSVLMCKVKNKLVFTKAK